MFPLLFFLIRIVGSGVPLGPRGTAATDWPIVPAPGDYDVGEFGGMKIGKGNRSTRRKPASEPLCSPQIPLDKTRAGNRAAAVGSQRLTAWAIARPFPCLVTYTLVHLVTAILNCNFSINITIFHTQKSDNKSSFFLYAFYQCYSRVKHTTILLPPRRQWEPTNCM
jgi:hypothetical protein